MRQPGFRYDTLSVSAVQVKNAACVVVSSFSAGWWRAEALLRAHPAGRRKIRRGAGREAERVASEQLT